MGRVPGARWRRMAAALCQVRAIYEMEQRVSWFIVDVYSDVKMQYRVAAETIEADASDEAQRRVAELYPRARTFRCMEIREEIAHRLRRNT